MHNLTVEFLGVEYARDVEYPTKVGGFTQESVVSRYLGQASTIPPYAVIFNTGLHDLAIPSDNATAVYSYRFNLETTFRHSDLYESLRTRGTKLVWISTSGVVPERQPLAWRRTTSNARIADFNEAAADVLQRWRIPSLDVYPLTRRPEVAALA